MSVLSPVHRRLAVSTLRAGGIIAYATEAVWGLGCDPDNAQAVQRLLRIKQRPWQKGMIVVAASVAQIEPYLCLLPADRRQQVLESWPGPFTWVLPVPDSVPVWLRGEHPSLAVRVSAHPGVQALCEAFGGPLVSTSANLSGRPPSRQPLDIVCQLGNAVDYIVPGRLGGQTRPTLIRDALTGAIIRPS